jgi:hypothetical protein
MHLSPTRGIVAILGVAALSACGTESANEPAGAVATSAIASAVSETGNGAPSGKHYTLNLIGTKDKLNGLPNENDGGRRIFVGFDRTGEKVTTRILLTEGEFDVIDANGTDGTASFQLPAPDEDGDGTTAYSVYVRTLGKPGGKATLQSCYVENGEEWCAVDFDGGVEPIELERTAGRSRFENVSKDLLYVDYCVEWAAGDDGELGTDDDVCTEVDQIALFSDDLIDYLWKYDNEGMKLVQLRFYEIPTDTPW